MPANQTRTESGWPMLLVAVIVCVIAGHVTAGLGDWTEQAKLLASDGMVEDYFGRAVSIAGNVSVVGAHRDDDNGEYSGSAYVYRYDGTNWVQEAKVVASDGEHHDNFGGSVSIAGDTIIIGAYGGGASGHEPGSAYVFRHNGANWVEEAILLASDAADDDAFGSSVAISGNTAIIGAISDDDNGESSGSAYVFRYDGTNWVEEAKLLASDGAAEDHFGNAVSLFDDTAVIGASGDWNNGHRTGSAYVFRCEGTNWVEAAKLVASDGEHHDSFGAAVSISGNTIVIGARGDDDNDFLSGSAYVFRDDGRGWVEEVKLLASDGAWHDYFGGSVSVSGDTIVIGAHGDDDNGLDAGAAYVFWYDGLEWAEQIKLLPSDGEAEDAFGCSVSVCGNTAIIGAYGDDDHRDFSGSAFIFAQCPADFDSDGDVDTTDLLTLLAAWGDCPMHCPWDFNGDGYVDDLDQEILIAHWGDCPEPPEECPWDLNGDDVVDGLDLMELLDHYGPCPLEECPSDLDGDRDTDTADLLALLAAWGVCP